MTRRLLAVLAVAVLGAALAAGPAAAAASPSPTAHATARRGRRARACPRGKRRVTVRVRRGRRWARVTRCVRRARRSPTGIQPGPPGPGGPTGPAPLFEPPGQRLDGDAAKPFLQRYLLNSTFTDCPAGWGVGGCSVEQRYSHHADTSWYYCRLTPTSGSDIRSNGSYTVQNATVNADGSWAFDEYVDAYGSRSAYEWHVATDGTVTGRYAYNGSIEQLGPLRYVAAAKDCSY